MFLLITFSFTHSHVVGDDNDDDNDDDDHK